MNWRKHITSDPEIMLGKAVIAGTRIPVDMILEKMSYGESIEELIKEYPHLNQEQIYAALAYAARFIQGEITYENAS